MLRDAYAAADRAGDLDNSDDCGVVLRYRPEVAIKCVRGSESNLKLTRPIDLVTADRLFQLRSSPPPPIRSPLSDAGLALAGKAIVVFGSSSGIGAEIVRLARAGGARTAGFSLSEGDVDVRSERDVARALAEAGRQLGPIDAVINAVGLLARGTVADQALATVRDTLDTNLLGAFVVARQALPHLRTTRGHLLFFTSSSYTRGRATYAAYSAAKAGLVNMVQALSEEAAAAGIKVNCISPERTATRMRVRAFPDEDQTALLQPCAVAEAALSLIATEMTGQIVDVKKSAEAFVVGLPRPERAGDERVGHTRRDAKRAVSGGRT